MLNKVITYGLLLSLFIPAIFLSRFFARVDLTLTKFVFIFFLIGYLVLGVAINLMPELINPYG